MDSQTASSAALTPPGNDTESKMRRNLGIDGAGPPSSNDPLKAARQAIRSQVTAREYTERQLAHAQGAIQDLRSRLRHVHQEREAAVKAAQSAMVVKDAAERSSRAAESALASERAARARVEGMFRDAEATIRDLREKLAAANHALHATEAELGAERQTHLTVEDQIVVTKEVDAPTIREVALPTVRKSVGRPRKIPAVEPAQAITTPLKMPQASTDHEEAVVPVIRKPVGRPRKVTAPEVQTPFNSVKNSTASAKVVTKKTTNRTEDEEPVQWWVEGWKGR
jgi:hypothetical protein